MIGGSDRVIVLYRPDGTPIYSTRDVIRQYGYEAVKREAELLIKSQHGNAPVSGVAVPAPALRQVGTIEHNYSTAKECVDGIRADLDVDDLPVGTKLYVLADGVDTSGEKQ